jgi:competence protein ComEC
VVPAALFPALTLIAGTAGGIALQTSWHLLLWLLPALTGAASLAWRLRYPRATASIIVVAFGCCGFILGSHAREAAIDTPVRLALDRELGGFRVDADELPGTHGPIATRLLLTEDASSGEDFTTLRARVSSIRLHDTWTDSDGGVVLSVGGIASAARVAEWRRGRMVEAPVSFRRPARYLDEGVTDFERDAALDGISLLGSIKSGLLVDVVRRGTIVSELAADARAFVRRAVQQRVGSHGSLSAAIVSAVLIGDRSGLPNEIRTRLQAAGTYHVIAISGGNIAILAALIVALLVPIGLSGRRAAFVTLMLLVAYAGIVTAGPSVWRATLVAIVYLTARLLDHRSTPWQAMAVAGGLLAIVEPLDVRNAGFILTFGATAALLEVARRSPVNIPVGSSNVRRGPLGPRSHLLASWLAASIAASAAVEIALLPVMAETFSRVTVAGLVLNLVAVPAMALVQIAGLVVVFANAFDAIGAIAGWLAHLGAMAIVDSARLVDVMPWLAVRVPRPAVAIVALYYVALAAMLLWRHVPVRLAGLTVLVVAGALIITGVRLGDDVSGLRLTMLDVGQGDGIVLQHGRRTLMVDTGGSPFGGGGFDLGSRVVEPALWARGVSSLETLLLTHGDPDHIGGAMPLIDDFNPTAVWQGVPVPRAPSLHAVLSRAAASGIPVEQRRQGEELHLGGARILVLHPPWPDWERQQVRNDDSVVLEVVYGDVAFLLTGDIGSDVERSIAPHLLQARTRILKVAHHGSRTSTSQELLDAWHPQIALISCGRGNPFGHPASEVVARLEAAGAAIYRTDRDGAITVDTDGQHVFVKTFTGEKP